jgi:hypothetical protein
MYYEFSLDDHINGEKWTQIGAENGDAFSQDFLAQLLFRAGGEWNCKRAIFWTQRAIEGSSDKVLEARREQLRMMKDGYEGCLSRGDGKKLLSHPSSK